MDEIFKDLAREYGRIQYNMARLKSVERLSDQSKGENFVLAYLMKHPEKTNPKEISRTLNISSARVAAVLNKLEERGMARRAADPESRRQTLVQLLPPGEEHHRQIQDRFLKEVSRMLEMLG